MQTLLDKAIAARDLVIWSNDHYRDVERLIELGRYQEAIALADDYIVLERARRKRESTRI